MKETTIRLRDLSIGYPDKHNTKRVAEHLNASIHSGELTCLLGTNGVAARSTCSTGRSPRMMTDSWPPSSASS